MFGEIGRAGSEIGAGVAEAAGGECVREKFGKTRSVK